MKRPGHILVIRLSAMGDVAMMVPVLKAFSEKYPDVRLTLLTAPLAPYLVGQRDVLRVGRLEQLFHGADARVPKFKHTLGNVFQMEPGESAILCELLLRGPQQARVRPGRG